MELQQFSIKIQRTGSAVQVLQKGEGPNLVFLHGAGGLAGWGQDLELLSRSFKVTVPLFPGFGQSTGIEGIDDVLDAVLHNFDVLKELRIYRPHLVGHSMGGMLAAEMAATCPNEVGKLTLIAPVGLWNDQHPILDFFTIMPQDISKYVFHDKNHPVAKAMSVIPNPDDEGIVDLFVNYMKGLAAAGRLLWPIPERGLIKRIGRITAQTMIVWGESDGLAPVFYAKEFGRLIPGSKVRIIKEASHMLPLEQPRQLANAITQFILETGIPKAPEGTKAPKPAKVITPAKAISPPKAKPAPKPAAPPKLTAKAKTKSPMKNKGSLPKKGRPSPKRRPSPKAGKPAPKGKTKKIPKPKKKKR